MAPIRVGVVGAGWTAMVQVPAFQALPEDFEVVALTSARRERADAAAAKLGIPNVFTDYRQMLALPGLDAVYIGAPPHLHHEMTLAAARAGKHLICEKPTALDAGQAREMRDAARDAGVTAMLDFEFRWRPARRYFAQLLAEGYTGRLYAVTYQNVAGFVADPVRRQWNWWSERSKGGGLLGAAGSHYIDALRVWCGEIESVQARLDTFVQERKLPDSEDFRAVDSDDSFSFFCRFAGGAEGLMTATGVARGPGSSLVHAFGSEGTLTITDDSRVSGAQTGASGAEDLPIPAEIAGQRAELPELIRYSAILSTEFARGIREGTSPSPNLEDGLRCQEVMDAIYASHASGRREEVKRAG
jgi:predicted dehydrogenase